MCKILNVFWAYQVSQKVFLQMPNMRFLLNALNGTLIQETKTVMSKKNIPECILVSLIIY